MNEPRSLNEEFAIDSSRWHYSARCMCTVGARGDEMKTTAQHVVAAARLLDHRSTSLKRRSQYPNQNTPNWLRERHTRTQDPGERVINNLRAQNVKITEGAYHRADNRDCVGQKVL